MKLTAPSGGSADELDGTGLNFTNGESDEALTVVDSTPGTPGTITIQGGVDMTSITTTTLNFSGANNTADLLDVKNGALMLAGSLDLKGDRKPTKALNFFDDSSATVPPSITAAFDSITDNVGGTDVGRVVRNNAQLLYYQVAFAPPAVGGLAPNRGPMGGGTVVTITGTYLDDATGVSFGTAPATSFVVNSDGSITAVAPASYSPGTVDVRVTTSEGTSATSSADQFTYFQVPVVMGISPSSGPTSGGTSVTIMGTGFTGATGVAFGGVTAPNFVVNGDGSITAVTPAGTAGTVDVTVTTANGTSATSMGDRFTYIVVPVVTGISPSSGPVSGGTSVTIRGSGLSGATCVFFGAVMTTNFVVNSDGSITVVAPPAYFAGTVDVTVMTPDGMSATSSADQFTYT